MKDGGEWKEWGRKGSKVLRKNEERKVEVKRGRVIRAKGQEEKRGGKGKG